MPTSTLHLGDLLHAVKLRHETDGFTSPPKEGVLRIFFALRIRRLRSGANPRTWVPNASTLPLEHQSRYISVMELGHLLTRSDFTYPEVSSKVCHNSFCQLGNSVSLPWVIYYGAFYLHVVSIFYCIPVICLKLVLFFFICNLCICFVICN